MVVGGQNYEGVSGTEVPSVGSIGRAAEAEDIL